MPGRNMTGPRGEGSLTGRGMGPCGGGTADGAPMQGADRGAFGCRRAYGRGFGYGGNASPDDQKEMLQQRKRSLERQLDHLSKKLEEWKEE